MLLAVDIGNTSTKFGVYDGDRLVSKVSIPTIREVTSEGLAAVLSSRLPSNITDAIVCSVVPETDAAMHDHLRSAYNMKPRYVTNDLDFGLKVNYEPLEAVGADRLVNAFSAAETYGVPSVVCSFGTALTIDAIDANRSLLGGIIAPGMKAMARALYELASRLPEVEVERTDAVIQNTTVGSISSGIFNGYLGMAEGLIRRIGAEMGGMPKVIATGGSADTVAPSIDLIDVVDGDLLLDGLQMLYSKITTAR
ncbi:MAG: type III pantothenate kinase [Pyrinomonadaceae bacterium]|nr:type III pantothenate kinase [Pyrinomonadaceae bacterium]